jgi:hypothetical protein
MPSHLIEACALSHFRDDKSISIQWDHFFEEVLIVCLIQETKEYATDDKKRDELLNSSNG